SGNTAVQIVSVNSGKVLDVSGGSQADGAMIIQYHFHGGANQLWYIIPVDEMVNGQRPYQIVSVNNSSKLIDVNRGSTEDGAKIQQWTDNGRANQLWFLLPVPGPASLPQPDNYALNGPQASSGIIRSGGQSRVPPPLSP